MIKYSTGRTKRLVYLALFSAILAVMASVPFLGFVPIGPIRATTLHLPVIVGSILLGPKCGAILGGVFGVASLLNSTFNPVITSFVFTPFYSFGNFHGNWLSLVICFVPRIFLGIVPFCLVQLLSRRASPLQTQITLAVSGFIASMLHSICVLGMIYLFFGQQYAQATDIPHSLLFGAIIGVLSVNGVVEAILAALLCTATAPLRKQLSQTPSSIH